MIYEIKYLLFSIMYEPPYYSKSNIKSHDTITQTKYIFSTRRKEAVKKLRF